MHGHACQKASQKKACNFPTEHVIPGGFTLHAWGHMSRFRAWAQPSFHWKVHLGQRKKSVAGSSAERVWISMKDASPWLHLGQVTAAPPTSERAGFSG